MRTTGLRALALALALVCASAVFGPGTAHAQLEVADDTEHTRDVREQYDSNWDEVFCQCHPSAAAA